MIPSAGRFRTKTLAVVAGVSLVAAGCSNDIAGKDDSGGVGPASEAVPVETLEPGTDDTWPTTTDGNGSLRDTDPGAYTREVVAEAVAMYDAEGLDVAVDHYSDPDNVDGSWYVFIIDESGDVLAHYQPDRVGENLRGWVGTDANGYEFGAEMLSADETGRWVSYVYTNPANGTLSGADDAVFELKHAWAVRHDGLLFGSGWYVNTDDFAPRLVSESAEHFRRGGIDAFLEFSNDPQGISAGFLPTAEYYNSTNTLDGFFSGFLADPDGVLLAHIDPSLIGTQIEDLLGPAVGNATSDGAWITSEDNPDGEGPETLRVWAMDVDGYFIGAGWYAPAP